MRECAMYIYDDRGGLVCQHTPVKNDYIKTN